MTEVPERPEDGADADAVSPLPSLAEARTRRRRRAPERVPDPPPVEPMAGTATPAKRRLLPGGRGKKKRDRRELVAEPTSPTAAVPPVEPPPVPPVVRPAPRIQPPESYADAPPPAPPMYPRESIPQPDPQPVESPDPPPQLYRPPAAAPAYPDPPRYQPPQARSAPQAAPRPVSPAPAAPQRPVSPPGAASRPRTFSGPPVSATAPSQSPAPPMARRPTEPLIPPTETAPDPAAISPPDDPHPVTPSAAAPVTPPPRLREPLRPNEPPRHTETGNRSPRNLVLLALILAVLAVSATAVITFDPFSAKPSANASKTEAATEASVPPTGPPLNPNDLPPSYEKPKLPANGDFLFYSWSVRKCVSQADPVIDPQATFETVLSSCDEERATIHLEKIDDRYRFQPRGIGGCVVPNGTGEGRGFRDGLCDREPGEFFFDDVDEDGFENVFRVRTAETNYCMSLDGTTIVQRPCAADDPNQQFALKAA